MPKPQVLSDSSSGPDAAVPLHCSWTTGGLDAAWVHVAGELDLATSAQLQRTLGEPPSQTRLIVLDLRELSFMDSSGVHAIVDASIHARHVGRRLVLLRGPPNVDRVFNLTSSFSGVELDYVDAAEAPPRARGGLVAEDLL